MDCLLSQEILFVFIWLLPLGTDHPKLTFICMTKLHLTFFVVDVEIIISVV